MKNRLTVFILCIVAFVAYSSCASSDKYLLIETEYGNMKFKLYKETPLHQKNFIKLVKKGYYDGMLFHRVIPGFMIQGGDPDSKTAKPDQRLGSGDPGYTIPAEINPQFFHKKGALAAARKGNSVNPDKESSGSQFFIVQGKKFTREELSELQQSKESERVQSIFHHLYNEKKEKLIKLRKDGKIEEFNIQMAELRQKAEEETKQIGDYVFSNEQIEAYTTLGGYPSLDNEYTVFGEIVEGFDVIDKIAAQPTGQFNRPRKDIKFKIKVVRK